MKTQFLSQAEKVLRDQALPVSPAFSASAALGTQPMTPPPPCLTPVCPLPQSALSFSTNSTLPLGISSCRSLFLKDSLHLLIPLSTHFMAPVLSF